LQKLTDALLNLLDNEIKLDVVQLAATYEHRCKVGSKEIFHIEAFIAKFMAV
jgi:replication factor C subunit 3/5